MMMISNSAFRSLFIEFSPPLESRSRKAKLKSINPTSSLNSSLYREVDTKFKKELPSSKKIPQGLRRCLNKVLDVCMRPTCMKNKNKNQVQQHYPSVSRAG